MGTEEGQIEDQSSSTKVEPERENKRFSTKQWNLLAIFALINFLSTVCVTLLSPFYPAEAERKGATASEYGVVFGIFEFTVFLTSPFFGKYIHKIGLKRVYCFGIVVSAMANISFGFMDKVEDHTTFIALCTVCRIFEGLGCAAFFTATFTIIACEFPDAVATTFASLETFFGLGFIVGPTLGGALFEVGGFSLPFFAIGSSLLVIAFVSIFVMPKIKESKEEEKNEEESHGFLAAMKLPSVVLTMISVSTTSISLGFVTATLEPHIRMFNLTPFLTGLAYMVNGAAYAIAAPIFGYICDHIKKPIYISILGNILIFLSFLIIGPAPFMPFDTLLWVTLLGLAIQGVGFGCVFVSGFVVGLQDSMKNGFPDNIATYGIISGIWQSMISLGAWLGPVLAGVLYDNFGFREGSWLILGSSAIMGVITFIHVCYSDYPTNSECQPLLHHEFASHEKEDPKSPKPSPSYGAIGEEGAIK